MTRLPVVPGYRIEKPIGRSGRLPLFAARREADGSSVVVKIVGGTVGVDRERFRREISILESLRHRHVIPVLEHGEFGDGAFLVMPAMNGSLAQRLHGLRARDALAIARALADALGAAHAVGVVHRNLKPDNVLFDTDDIVVLSDFGLARAPGLGKSLTGDGAVVGSPRYMSPEQIRDLPTDARSDLYSLGVLLFEMLTGHPPFRDADFLSVALQHLTEPLPPLPDVDADVRSFVAALCAKEPSARPPDAASAMRTLDALLARS